VAQLAWGLIPDGIIEIFHLPNLSGHAMSLGSTQLLTEMSTRNISWAVKEAGAQVWKICHLPTPGVLKSGSLEMWNS
jgi:hypothetical protein